MMGKTSKAKELEKELGRWQKKVEDQQTLLQKREAELSDAENGLKEIATLMDVTLTQIAVCHGTKVTDDESGELLGYRLEIPKFKASEVLEKYELRAGLGNDGECYTIGVVMRHEG